MIEYWYRSRDVPPEDRVDYWREIALGLWGAVDITTDAGPEFPSTSRTLDLGGFAVGSSTLAEFSMRRTAAHVRQDDPETAVLSLVEQGEFDFAQCGRQARVRPGGMLIYHTSAPSEGIFPASTTKILQFPRALLPAGAENLLATELSTASGLGALVAGSLREMASLQADRAEEAARLATITLDLLGTLCLRELAPARPPAPSPAVLLTAIHAFIRRHLADPALGPAMIADAHHISVRYLHKLFHQQQETVAGRIRDLRLENCRRDLADPALRERPAHVVARRWGFTDSAHFSRAFRAAFGVPPGEYRKLTQASFGRAHLLA